MPNEQQTVLAALRRAVGKCEYQDEANALRTLADRVEGDQEYSDLSDQLQAIVAERDRARSERDTAHVQADTAELRRAEAQTTAEGAIAERERTQQELDECKRELRMLRARMVITPPAPEPPEPEHTTASNES